LTGIIIQKRGTQWSLEALNHGEHPIDGPFSKDGMKSSDPVLLKWLRYEKKLYESPKNGELGIIRIRDTIPDNFP